MKMNYTSRETNTYIYAYAYLITYVQYVVSAKNIRKLNLHNNGELNFFLFRWYLTIVYEKVKNYLVKLLNYYLL